MALTYSELLAGARSRIPGVGLDDLRTDLKQKTLQPLM
jgi:hypothetical protein